MSAMDLFKIFISAALVDNIILARYIGYVLTLGCLLMWRIPWVWGWQLPLSWF